MAECSSSTSNDLFLRWLVDEEEDDEIVLYWMSVRKRKRRSISNVILTRYEEGCFETLINRHLLQDETKFREFFRLNVEQFHFVLDLVKDDLTKPGSCRIRTPISAAEKLALTLRFLATGETFASLSFSFRISKGYLSKIIEQVLTLLSRKLVPIFMPPPTKEKLKECSEEFNNKWQFPNCVAGIDGKHIRMICPPQTGSLYYNFHEYFSTVLLAVVDANCKFIMVDVGSYGKEGDSGIFEKSRLGSFLKDSNSYPAPSQLPGSTIVAPYVVVGDEAFRLAKHMMKPYSKPEARSDIEKRIYNYRLCRARRVTENSFALLSQVFRVFYTPIAVKVTTCDKLVMTACCLHNLLRNAYLEKNGRSYFKRNISLASPTENLIPLRGVGGFAHTDGFEVRQQFTDYFSTHGSVPWQYENILSTS